MGTHGLGGLGWCRPQPTQSREPNPNPTYGLLGIQVYTVSNAARLPLEERSPPLRLQCKHASVRRTSEKVSHSLRHNMAVLWHCVHHITLLGRPAIVYVSRLCSSAVSLTNNWNCSVVLFNLQAKTCVAISLAVRRVVFLGTMDQFSLSCKSYIARVE